MTMSKFSFLLGTAIFVILLSIVLWKPLPETLTEHGKLERIEPIIRLVLYYPNKILSFFGLYNLRIKWTRVGFEFGNWFHGNQTIGKFEKVEDTFFDSIPVRVYNPAKRTNNGAIFFIHGGGYVIGSYKSHDAAVRLLSSNTGIFVVSINYRLAPEFKFPTAVDDVQRAVLYFVSTAYKKYNVDTRKLVVAGDSAGGALSAIICQRLQKKSLIKYPIKLQILIYPVTQFVDVKTPSYQMVDKGLARTAFLDTDSLIFWFYTYLDISMDYYNAALNNEHLCDEKFRKKYASHLNHVKHSILPFKKDSQYYIEPNYEKCQDRLNLSQAIDMKIMNADFAPLMANDGDLRGLPQALVVTCEFDPLRDDGYWYYYRLKNEGVKATWIHYKEGFHGLINLFKNFELGRKMIDEISDFIVKNI